MERPRRKQSDSSLKREILVPYPTESALSGIQRHDDQMWYRKVFQVPGDWDDQSVVLHFGAVDQIATVWVNNKQVARHEGGYTEFSADITSALRTMGPQELTVRVEDRNEGGPFAVGKQRNGVAALRRSRHMADRVAEHPVPRASTKRRRAGSDQLQCQRAWV